ncbi:MAG: DNA repair protein RecO [Clostridia bacterium]|nr:DNA repair protein RecO [Clostridia bacterium]
MVIETEGIVLRQTKTANGKKILTLFTPKYGKISVSCNLAPSGKNKSSLYTRPFTYARYSIFKGKEMYSLNGAEVLESFYSIGEDFDKYVTASYALELTEKLVFEDQPDIRLFNQLSAFLKELSGRSSKYDTLLLAYMVKIMSILGIMPELSHCMNCSTTIDIGEFFSASHGGMLCRRCAVQAIENDPNQLIYSTDFGIIDTIRYFEKESLETFRKVALSDAVEKRLKKILLEYIKYHLDIGELKTENLDIKKL